MWYYTAQGSILPVSYFPITPALQGIAIFIQGFMTTQAQATLLLEMQSFERLRPFTYPLHPIIAIVAPHTMPAQHQVQQMPEGHGPIQGMRNAMRSEHELIQRNNKQGKTAGFLDCQDFPLAAAEQQQLRDRLLLAMTDYSAIVEKPDAVKVRRLRETDKNELEIIAWKVLVSILYLHMSITTNLADPLPNRRSLRTPKMG